MAGGQLQSLLGQQNPYSPNTGAGRFLGGQPIYQPTKFTPQVYQPPQTSPIMGLFSQIQSQIAANQNPYTPIADAGAAGSGPGDGSGVNAGIGGTGSAGGNNGIGVSGVSGGGQAPGEAPGPDADAGGSGGGGGAK